MLIARDHVHGTLLVQAGAEDLGEFGVGEYNW
jgi:hypothetical protein